MQALGQHVLIKPSEQNDGSEIEEYLKETSNIGEITSVGKSVEAEVNVGDKVAYSMYGFMSLNKELVVVHQRELLAKLG